jgi:hypothetical protein
MRPNAAQLAHRDPALAAALGALRGADYGVDRTRADFGGMFGFSPFDPSRNIGFGVDAPPPPPMQMMHPAVAEAMAAQAGHPAHHGHHMAQWQRNYNGYVNRHGVPPFWDGRYGYYGDGFSNGPGGTMGPEVWAAEHAATARRAAILDPNEHSRLKIERYSFAISPDEPFSLGTGGSFEATLQPNTRIRPQRILTNAPVPNFVLLDGIQVANVNVLVGGTEDAYTYAATAQGVMLDLPTLDPANRATVSGLYTGLLPPGYAAEFPFLFITTFQGPSTIVGGL